jgi:hypothetical protein
VPPQIKRLFQAGATTKGKAPRKGKEKAETKNQGKTKERTTENPNTKKEKAWGASPQE